MTEATIEDLISKWGSLPPDPARGNVLRTLCYLLLIVSPLQQNILYETLNWELKNP